MDSLAQASQLRVDGGEGQRVGRGGSGGQRLPGNRWQLINYAAAAASRGCIICMRVRDNVFQSPLLLSFIFWTKLQQQEQLGGIKFALYLVTHAQGQHKAST